MKKKKKRKNEEEERNQSIIALEIGLPSTNLLGKWQELGARWRKLMLETKLALEAYLVHATLARAVTMTLKITVPNWYSPTILFTMMEQSHIAATLIPW